MDRERAAQQDHQGRCMRRCPEVEHEPALALGLGTNFDIEQSGPVEIKPGAFVVN
jgi:hypothetical protein